MPRQHHDPRTSLLFPLAKRFWGFIEAGRNAVGLRWIDTHKLTPVAARTYDLLTTLVEQFCFAATSPDRAHRDPAPAAEIASPDTAAPEPEAELNLTPHPTRTRALGRGPLPPGQGWLITIAPELHSHGLDFINLLQLPEMRALLAARPGLWRFLRPICRMFGIQSIDAPPLPKRNPRPYRPRPRRSAAERHEDEMCRLHGPQGYRPSCFSNA
ncbi:MAG: hypothetical protein KGI51_13725 [Rhodospirillales bacterium]|nr:hypothetical protein [Rhodospirillales bacterium]